MSEPERKQPPTSMLDVLGDEGGARVLHAMMEAYKSAVGQPSNFGFSYDALPHEIRKSIVRALGDVEDGEITTPEQLHDRWVDSRVALGWTGGIVRDDEQKAHPAIGKLWEEMPLVDQTKDRLFLAIVRALSGK